MCGIFGAANPAGAVIREPGAVLAMGGLIAHRGPDHDGWFQGDSVILGSRRLSIIDLSSRANQPFASPDGLVQIVCNGEIYNADEIRGHYSAQGYAFRSDHNDVESILPLYLEHGAAAIGRLEGMFGLAIWDQRNQTLLLARDRAGEKSLFYRMHDGELRFASEIQPLLAVQRSAPVLSRAGLSDYLTLGYCLAPNTMFEGIHKLPAAHLLVADRAGLHLRRYWDPAEHAAQPLQANAGEIQHTVSRAVERQLVADVPLGVFTSGGLDSSLIAAETVRHLSPTSVNTYAVGFNAASYDESDWAAKVARHLGTRHHTVQASQKELHRALDTIVTRVAEPMSDPAVLPTLLLAEAASADVRVVLSGEGADEIFGGYPTYLGHRWAERFRHLPAPLRHAFGAAVRRLPVTRRKVSLAFLARRFVEEAELAPLQRHVAWFGLLGPHAAETADGYLPPVVVPFWNGIEGAVPPVKRAMVFDLQTYLAENLLIKLDRATMLNSIEARAPFLDRQMLELGLRQPVDSAVGSVSTKIALKQAAEGLLPKEIIYRRKRGLSVPVADWILGDLSAEVDDLFDPARLQQQEMLRPEPVLAMLKEHRAGHADHGRRLWPLYMLQRWYRQWCEI